MLLHGRSAQLFPPRVPKLLTQSFCGGFVGAGAGVTDVPPGQLHGRVPVDVGQQAQAETLRVGGVSEAIHGHGGLRGVESLPHPLVELVVGYGAPEGRLAVSHRLQICTKPEPSQPQQGKGG